MKIINIIQGEKEWLDWRKRGITASDVPILLGCSPYKTKWKLWAEKTGLVNPEDLSRNPNVRRGNNLEDKIRQIAETHCNGDPLLPICAEYDEWNILRASLDGFSSSGTPWELKANSKKVFDQIKKLGTESEAYKLYEAQVLTQCIVTGSSKGKLVFFNEKNAKHPLIFDIELNDIKKAEIIKACKEFYSCIINNEPPEIDTDKDLFIPNKDLDKFLWSTKADEWNAKKAQLSKLENEVNEIKAEMSVLQDDFQTMMGVFKNADLFGVKVSRYETSGTIDYKSFIANKFKDVDIVELNKELEAYRKSSRNSIRVTGTNKNTVNIAIPDMVSTEQGSYF